MLAASSMDISETVAESPMPAPKVGTPRSATSEHPTAQCNTLAYPSSSHLSDSSMALGLNIYDLDQCHGLCIVDTESITLVLQGKVQRMRPSPFHKGSGDGTAAETVPKRPAAATKKPAARSRKVASEVTNLCLCSCCA